VLTDNGGLLVGLPLLYASGGVGEGHNFGEYFRPENSLLVVLLCPLTTAPLPKTTQLISTLNNSGTTSEESAADH
jgi:hypothetical protein